MKGDKDWLEEPLRALAEQERGHRREPPGAGELLDYYFGTLPQEEAEALRDRLALSREASAALLDMASFPKVESRKADFHLTEADVDAQWRRMEKLLAATEDSETPAAPAPAPPVRSFAFNYGYALAAALLLAVVGLSVWVWRLHRSVDRLSEPRVDVYLADLIPDTSERGGDLGDTEPVTEIRVPAWSDRVLLVLNLAEPTPAAELLVEVRDAESSVEIWNGGGVGRRSDNSVVLEVPRDFLPPGRYQVRLLSRDGDPRLLARYVLEIGYD